MWKRYLSFKPSGKFSLNELNRNVLEAKYAVRGKIPIRADELSEQLRNDPSSLPFNQIIYANIGNPQQLDQRPLTWYREVLSILQNPNLLGEKLSYKPDVIRRAEKILSDVKSVGAYSNSKGGAYIRESVARFISERDGYSSDPANIFLTNGASTAVSYLLQVLTTGPDSGFLIPIPQYPLYTASIALNDAKAVGYFLDESNNWSTAPDQIRRLIEDSKSKNINIKSLVVINPGNPTGSVLSYEDIVGIIDIAAEHGIVIIADEVYQKNIYEREFISVKKVLSELNEKHPELYENVQLASLHSTSKGVSGECGQRGGYMELVGFEPEVKDVLFKLASINLCSVVSGQALVELMVNPPKPGEPSYEVYNKETTSIHENMEKRATMLYNAFSEMPDVSCNKPMGAMYLFPRLNFTESTYSKLFEVAKEKNTVVDELYCMELLENTGICCVPGSGFGQVPGSYHLRTTFLAPGSAWIDNWKKFHKDFVAKYKD